MAALDWLLAQPWTPQFIPMHTLADWKRMSDHFGAGWSEPIDRAIIGGWYADRLSYAFMSGYQAALRRLVPSLPWDVFAALCVTEADGNSPRDIHTQLATHDDDPSFCVLNGTKTFVTGGDTAQLLLVAASEGRTEDGKNRIRLVIVKRDTQGVHISHASELHFLPEVQHSRVDFDNVQVRRAQIFPGDGYTRYLKPFRTLEDIHVFAAALAHIYHVARIYEWPAVIKEDLISQLVALRALALSPSEHPSVHIALGGLLRQAKGLLARLDDYWPQTTEDIFTRWERDKCLFDVAESLRERRLQAAWRYYGD